VDLAIVILHSQDRTKSLNMTSVKSKNLLYPNLSDFFTIITVIILNPT